METATSPTQDTIESQKPQHLSNLWTMFYRHGMNANLSKSFYCDGKMLDAQKRAKEHCKVMNYRFIFVRPLICNLEEEEESQLKGTVPGENTA